MAKFDNTSGCPCGLYRECEPGCAFNETKPPKVRTPQDYAIEFGEYLAKAAEAYMETVNAFTASSNAYILFSDSEARESDMTEAWNSLRSAVYEFRKRAILAGRE